MFEQHLRQLHLSISTLSRQVETLTQLTSKGFGHMATKAQIDNLMSHVAALITAGTAEITAAVAAAKQANADMPDPAIDEMDARVQAAIKSMNDAAAQLSNPNVSAPVAPVQPATSVGFVQQPAFPQDAPQPAVEQPPEEKPKLG